MTFTDYLECITAKVRRDLDAMTPEEAPLELRMFPSKDHVFALFHKAHLFNLGDADDINKAAEELKESLVEDFKEGVPAPFDNLIVAFHRLEGWGFEWHLKLTDHMSIAKVPEERRRNLWLTVDLSEPSLSVPAFTATVSYQVLPPTRNMLTISLDERLIDLSERLFGQPRAVSAAMMSDGIGAALRRIALISHPSNYMIRTTPKLTPKEQKRTMDRGELPVRKRPYYIVIDHEALVALNSGVQGTGHHHSAAPHARRGHWMRLAERCKAAKASGKDRVWRRETYVGQQEFEDERNRYRVILGNPCDERLDGGS